MRSTSCESQSTRLRKKLVLESGALKSRVPANLDVPMTANRPGPFCRAAARTKGPFKSFASGSVTLYGSNARKWAVSGGLAQLNFEDRARTSADPDTCSGLAKGR